MGGWFRWGGLCVNGYFVCMGLRGKILRSWVGAVPVCPPESPCKGAYIVQFLAYNACIFGMETPLPAHVALQGRIHRSIPHTQCVYFLVWKRCCANVRAGTQEPPLRFRLGRLDVGGFVCWENGAQEPTPSGLYFCQPRVADDRRLPWVKSWGGPMPSALYFLKSIFV